jgi:ferritin-like metal-binding protein YciE/nucleoside-diphosphate-sugar epimerase
VRVVVTGATGNVGTSVIEALAERGEIKEVVGLARRAPTWKPEKTKWVNADVVSSPLEPVFEGADAVIHLAWAIQPSHDAETLERINVDGSRRVFEAVAAAGVPKLIYASSVGAYAPGPKSHPVTEDWPVGGTETSFYSRHKALVEEQLNEFEARVADTKVVRLRPALIFKGEAATEIRRLFAGPFLPSFLLRSGLIPAIPRLPGLRFQAVHTSDVGRAYALAAIRDVSGAFNLAANPPLGSKELAAVLDARTFPLPVSVARRLADLTWRLRLQPTPAGWLDMALDVPLMSSERAEQELGWQPQVSAIEALAELIAGLRNGNGKPTPPLESAGLGGRFDELRTGVGGRQWVHGPDEKLVKHLADVHSVEEQALIQMRKAPKIAGDDQLAEVFEEHLSETEEQERRVRERLKAHGADPSTLKDLAGKAGGIGMVVFAASQPDTAGKLTAHAFSYEHLEIAAYELLRRTAEEAGDDATAAMAREIADEEQRMADRLEASFDAAVDASLNGSDEAELSSQLNRYLADAHAIEKQGLQLLETAPRIVEDAELREFFGEHLRQSEKHEQMIRERLEARGAKPSKAKDAALRLGGLQVGAFFAAQPDTAAKLTGFAFAFEHLEIAAYELLKRVARQAGDKKALGVAERILAEERAAASKLASRWDRASSPANS